MNSNPAFLAELSEHVVLTKTPARAISALGLDEHPSCSLAEHYRDRIYAKAVFGQQINRTGVILMMIVYIALVTVAP
jgi:hypothetical protein